MRYYARLTDIELGPFDDPRQATAACRGHRHLLFTLVPVDEIDERYPPKVLDVDDLVKSIDEVGLTTPVLVVNGILVHGYRRMAAMKRLGWTMIPVLYTEEL